MLHFDNSKAMNMDLPEKNEASGVPAIKSEIDIIHDIVKLTIFINIP